MHGVVGLQRGQAQVAGFALEGHGVGDDVAHAKAGVELAEVDVPVLAHVDVLHAVELETLRGELSRGEFQTLHFPHSHIEIRWALSYLKMTDEGGGSGRDKALLSQDARLHVVELQTGVVARHLT